MGLTKSKMRKIEHKVERRVNHGHHTPRVSTFVHRPRRCFPSSATIELANGESRRMDQLSHGDEVLTINSRTGLTESSPIFFFGHRDSLPLEEFTCLTTSTNSTLCLTEDHFLVAAGNGEMELANAKFVRGGKIVVGMSVWEQKKNGDGGMMERSEVVKVEKRFEYGLWNPYTLENAMIVVNGVVASTHSAWFLDDVMPSAYDHLLPSIYEAALRPARAAYRLMGAEWAKSVQARLDLDTSAQESSGLIALLAPYAQLVASEAPAFASQIVSRLV